MPSSTLSRIEAYARVAEARSFSLAARKLGVSKGAVSKTIAALEADLGVRLLQRSTRQVTLTEAGEVFLRSALAILAEAEAAEARVRELHDEARGLVRVNAPTGFASLWLAPALPSFLARHPQVSVHLEGDDRRVDVAHGGWDVVVRVGKLADSDLVARKLAPVRAVLVASPGYLARRGAPERPEDLKDHECITYSLVAAPERWPLSRRGKTTTVRVGGRLRTNADAATRGALLADGGIAMLPSFTIAEELRRGELVIVLPGWEVPLDMHALMPPAHAGTAKVRTFVDFLVERFASDTQWSP